MRRRVSGLILLVFFLSLNASEPGEWQNGVDTCNAILDLIQERHPDPPPEKELVYASIRGILSRLDPHSYFLDPASFRSMFEDQHGNYFGIGTRIRSIDGRLTVIAPMEGTPAHRQGILPGDVISTIDGHPTREMSIDQAMKALRGSRGSTVTIIVEREGERHPLTFRMRRAEIPLATLTYSLLQPDAPEIGYIGLRTFGQTSPQEVRDALEALLEKGKLRGLVLDLRWNTGGSLAAAIELADMFLPPGRPIITLKGRSMERGFTSRKKQAWPDLKLVVLINRGSASSSEILAAALQEHERARILGSRSWGKGLVETVFTLPGKSAIALTTARYYTPRGRCLQREYGGADNLFGIRIPEDYDTNRQIPGGVIPDQLIADPRLSPTVANLISRGAFFQFSRRLLDKGLVVSNTMRIDSPLIAEFQSFLDEKNIPVTDSEIARKEIQREILRALLTMAISETAGYRIFLSHDPVNTAALAFLKSTARPKEPQS